MYSAVLLVSSIGRVEARFLRSCTWRNVHKFVKFAASSAPKTGGHTLGVSATYKHTDATAVVNIDSASFSSSDESMAALVDKRIRQRQCSALQLQQISSRLKYPTNTLKTLIDATMCVQYLQAHDQALVLPFMDQCVTAMEGILRRDPRQLFLASYIASISIGIKRVQGNSSEIRRILFFMKNQVDRCYRDRVFVKEKHICKILYGLQGLTADIPEVSNLLSTLMRARLSKRLPKLKPHYIGMALYGLQRMGAESPEVRAVLTYLAKGTSNCREMLEAQAIGMALFGMRSMNAEEEEVRVLLSSLSDKIASSSSVMSSAEVSMAVDGLQNMSSRVTEVAKLISSISPKVKDCKDTFRRKHVPMCLNGFKNMYSSSPEALALLAELTPKLRSCPDELDDNSISMSIFGLRHMSSDSDEVCAALAAILPKIEDYCSTFNSMCAAWTLYGFHMKNDNKPEILTLISEMSRIIGISDDIKFCGKEIAISFFGLKSCSNGSVEVRQLLQVLTSKIATDCSLTRSEAAMALYGLQNMSSDIPEVRYAVRRLVPLIKECNGPMTSQEVGMAIFSFRSMTSDSADVRLLLSAVSDMILASEVKLDAQYVNSALRSLSGMDFDLQEMKKMLSILSISAAKAKEMIQKISVPLPADGVDEEDRHAVDMERYYSPSDLFH